MKFVRSAFFGESRTLNAKTIWVNEEKESPVLPLQREDIKQ